MTEHLPECPMLKPCSEEYPEHGLCGNFTGACMHCMAECICYALRACEERAIAAAVQRVEAEVATYGIAMDAPVMVVIIAAIKGERP